MGPQLDSSLRSPGIPPGAPLAQAPLAYDAPKAWYDKLFDALIGPAEGPNSKYALICSKCYAHNGLAVAEEFEDIRWVPMPAHPDISIATNLTLFPFFRHFRILLPSMRTLQ